MEIKNPRIYNKQEAKNARQLRAYMEAKGWYIKKLHGNKYQSGLPDFIAFHSVHGHKWIETKSPGGKLNQAQINEFTRMATHGEKIYVLETYNDYMLLFNKYDNWRDYR